MSSYLPKQYILQLHVKDLKTIHSPITCQRPYCLLKFLEAAYRLFLRLFFFNNVIFLDISILIIYILSIS